MIYRKCINRKILNETMKLQTNVAIQNTDHEDEGNGDIVGFVNLQKDQHKIIRVHSTPMGDGEANDTKNELFGVKQSFNYKSNDDINSVEGMDDDQSENSEVLYELQPSRITP